MGQGFSNNRVAFAGNGITQILVNGTKVNTTAGSTHDYTIPAGVKRVTISFASVSTSAATAGIGCRLGDVDGVQTSAYTNHQIYLADGGNSAGNTNVAGDASLFSVRPTNSAAAADVFSGLMELVLHDAATNTWVMTSSMMDSSAALKSCKSGGNKVLTGELTTVQIITTTGTFDAGSVNIQYDNPDPTVVAGSGRGIVVQEVRSTDASYFTLSTVVPNDDSIPQNTEGSEIITVSITPTNANNILVIDAILPAVTSSATARLPTFAIFQDSDADALSVGLCGYNAGNLVGACAFSYRMTAGTTNSTTFKLRGGSNVGNTHLNGNLSVRRYGGASIISLTVREIEA